MIELSTDHNLIAQQARERIAKLISTPALVEVVKIEASNEESIEGKNG